jgi:glucokinase
MKKQEVIAGVDIGGTNTVLGLIDNENNYLAEKSFETKSENGIDVYIERLVNSINEIFEKFSDAHELIGIGLAAPNANFLTGIIENSVNLKWRNVNLVDLIKKHFNIPIAMINDANAAALGEQICGSAKGMRNFIVLTLGTGLGSGIVVDGNLIYGENGLAGELGHVIVKSDGRKCNCGKNGCLETYISANGIRRTVFDLISYYNEETELQNISFNKLTSKYISELALKNDVIALKAFEFTGEILGRALSNVVAYFDPEAIILVGGLSESGDLLLKPTKFYFEKYLLNIYKGKVQILKSALQNGRAAVLGASSFVTKEINKVRVNYSINSKEN